MHLYFTLPVTASGDPDSPRFVAFVRANTALSLFFSIYVMGLWKLSIWFLAISLCLFVGVDGKPQRDAKFCNVEGARKPGFNFNNQSCYYLSTDGDPEDPRTVAPGCHREQLAVAAFPNIHSAEEDDFLGSIILDGPNDNKTIILNMQLETNGTWRDHSKATYWAEWGRMKPDPRPNWVLIGNYSSRNGELHSNWYYDSTWSLPLTVIELTINASCQWSESLSVCVSKEGWCGRTRSITVLADRIVNEYCNGTACPKSTTEECPKDDPCWLITTTVPPETTTSFCPFAAYSSPVMIAAAYGFYVFCVNNLIQ